MLERYFGSNEYSVIPELGFEVVQGKKELDEELLKRTSWLTDYTVHSINFDENLRNSLIHNFPQVTEKHIDIFLKEIPEKTYKTQGKIGDFSVSEQKLYGAQKRWYQQIFKTIHLSDPQARLIYNVEEIVEDLVDSKKKGRLILSPASLMIYEFSAFTDTNEYSGVFMQTSFISAHSVKRVNGNTTLGSVNRGKLERFYDEESIFKLRRYRKSMKERRRVATGSSAPNGDYTAIPKYEK